MDHIAAAQERLVTERLRKKLNDVNVAAQTHLSPITDHVNFTLQQAYFKCAYDCFDRRRKQEEINNCVENCSIPVMNANSLVENEMAKFQERMNRSMMVCQDKFETATKFQQQKGGAMNDLESCVDLAIEDSIQMLPHVVNQLKATLSINE
ncbi:hypothetical protein AQUCO_05800034v1 [Aquilegia coerulea]|uniref:Protein FAM136A n=1 Tax=Aquilegia coerulea TaxID=218851 RepID=A0A2G5CEG3_AQUCA|nr:hypothetical protein AQUCO_05800034v1 [Aquilegia coerulea]